MNRIQLVLLLVEPQEAAFSVQQARPFTQQLAALSVAFWQQAGAFMPLCCEAEQQAEFSVQHFIPSWQQAGFESAVQQSLLGLQHAAFVEQQSFACSVAPMTFDSIKPKPSSEPTKSFANIVILLQIKRINKKITLHNVCEAIRPIGLTNVQNRTAARSD